MFGWDKKQTDSQPTRYLMDTIFINIGLIDKMFEGMGR